MRKETLQYKRKSFGYDHEAVRQKEAVMKSTSNLPLKSVCVTFQLCR